jgi:exocyst complex component 1
MIKKKSKGDIANAFKRAAATANAFKPRPGGAGDRLRQAQNRSNDGPDGITGVVPAPPRPVSVEKPKPTPELSRPVTPQRSSAVPEVKVTLPPSSRPSSLQATAKAPSDPQQEEVVDARRSIVAGNDLKYLATLGIDPSSILDNRSTEFTKWLDYFGWVPGDQMRSRHFEEMRIDIDRELNKAQAGGWLARFQEEDERVNSIKRGIDSALGECEELDNLLTLYSVELSVRTSHPSQLRTATDSL